MSCLRCGKNTEEEQVFCEECLAQMEQEPIPPGTPIQLPNRANRYNTKRTTFKNSSSKWADKIFRLRYLIFWLVVLCVLLAASLVLCISLLTDTAPQWIRSLLHW